MKVILFMAMSVNGCIARKNGDEDFLSHKNWEAFCNLAKECGCFIVGRKTFEAVQKWNIEPFVLGEGIPLFSKDDFENNLELLSNEKLDNGIIQLRYLVSK